MRREGQPLPRFTGDLKKVVPKADRCAWTGLPPAGSASKQPRKEHLSTAACTDKNHKGHRYYTGGILDGHVAHLIYAHPSDYPQTTGTMLRDGTRSWYEIDYDASTTTEVIYRFIGQGASFPEVPA